MGGGSNVGECSLVGSAHECKVEWQESKIWEGEKVRGGKSKVKGKNLGE